MDYKSTRAFPEETPVRPRSQTARGTATATVINQDKLTRIEKRRSSQQQTLSIMNHSHKTGQVSPKSKLRRPCHNIGCSIVEVVVVVALISLSSAFALKALVQQRQQLVNIERDAVAISINTEAAWQKHINSDGNVVWERAL